MGKWQADQLKLELTAEGEGAWHLNAQVANTMNCKVTKAGDSYSAGLVSSTRMLPPPDLQEKEREVSNLLANLNSISLEGGQLKIASDSSAILLDRAKDLGEEVAAFKFLKLGISCCQNFLGFNNFLANP